MKKHFALYKGKIYKIKVISKESNQITLKWKKNVFNTVPLNKTKLF